MITLLNYLKTNIFDAHAHYFSHRGDILDKLDKSYDAYVGFMDENGEYSDLRKFKNIKITRKTRIDTEASNSDSSILNIDEDGDGKYDIRLKAEANGYGEEITTSNWIIYVIIGAVAFVMLDIIAIVIYTKKKKRRGE